MKRLCLALAVGVLLLLVTGVGTATASPPVIQDSGQLAGSDQDAGAAAGTAQQEPSNSNTSVRVLSPGDDGDVSQTNEATSDAKAANLNATEQDADQTQSGGGLQVIGQKAENEQDAFGLALTAQEGASNDNGSVRVLSEGDGGDVTQENIASSDADAVNANLTGQDADQTQSGGSCCGSGGEQLIGQRADSEQDATAISATEQEKPSNTNVSVRVLSPGDDGDVSQTNEATSDAKAANLNATEQDADQTQSGGDCKCSHGGTQVVGQKADSEQDATALAATKQVKPSNKNISVRVLSPGDDGDVTQTNEASSTATSANLNATKQDADQTQGGGSGEQVIGQSADNDQKALAGALTVQEKPSNENISVRVLSPGKGGSVTQTNTASSNATAANLNTTKQDADQTQAGSDCKCKTTGGEQLIGQSAKNEQDATALSATIQEKPSNTNTPIRVLSKGDDGDVTQTNEASSTATAANLNETKQDADQTQTGGSCKCDHGLQVIGQSAKNDQDATAIAATFQVKPSNTNTPIRVLSKGDGGDVTQTNEASSTATAANLNATKQDAEQSQAGSGLQVIGQAAKNEQDAFALGLTFQVGASNENAPVRVLSKGDGGDVTQTNTASSNAVAANLNAVTQDAEQTQGSMRCCGTGIQAVGQLAENKQGAVALSFTAQLADKHEKQPCVCGEKGSIGNSHAPVRVASPGDDGSIDQSNVARSSAIAANWNVVKQTVQEIQAAPCLCKQPGIQAVGQHDDSSQFAVADGAGLQLHPKSKRTVERW